MDHLNCIPVFAPPLRVPISDILEGKKAAPTPVHKVGKRGGIYASCMNLVAFLKGYNREWFGCCCSILLSLDSNKCTEQ